MQRQQKRKPANYRKKRSFLQFCAFAEKNAVSLAKPDCKGALAQKKPLLTKRPKPKPTNSALASKKPYITKSHEPKPRKKNAGSTGGKTFQGENRQTIQEFCFAEFLSFCTRLLIKQEFPDAKAPLSLKFSRFFKSEVCPALPKQPKQYKQETGKLSQKAQLFAVLAQGVCTKHEYFDAKTGYRAERTRRKP